MPASPPITIGYATAQLHEWTQALEACASGANYAIAGRSLTRQDVPTIRGEIQRWHNTLAALEVYQATGGQRPLGARASFPAPGSGS